MEAAVIVEPEVPENTGFIARLAANFDSELRLVNPGFNLEEARETAKNAQEKLRGAEIFDTVEEAVEDLDYVIGTKPGRGSPVRGFESRENTSVMIGRESSGLSNRELELCETVVHIETQGYSSLNQSHAAAILFHSISSKGSGEGISGSQVQKLEEIAPELTAEKILASNPSSEEVSRVIGELKKLEKEN